MSIPYLRDWAEALETVAAITGVVIVFMFPPPGPSLEGRAVAWPQFASFVGAFGILYLKSIVQKQIAPSLALIAFLAGISLLIAYFVAASFWTCQLELGRVVIGSLSTVAENVMAKNSHYTCAMLLDDFASNPRIVYTAPSLIWHEVSLGLLYVVAIASLT